MGEILENVFNSVIDKLNSILQPLLCLLVCWLPNDCQVRLLRQVCQYYFTPFPILLLTGWCIKVLVFDRDACNQNEGDPESTLPFKCSCSVVAHAGALLHVNKCL